MTHSRTKIVFVFLFVIVFCGVGLCGRIVYPWNATTTIVKAGESFTVWFDADDRQDVASVTLRGLYNSVSIPNVTTKTGSWVYDEVSGNSYDTQIAVKLPSNTPMERYDLVLNTSTGQEVSQSAVKVIKQCQKEYSIFHISDTHIRHKPENKGDGTIRKLQLLTGLVDIANIIGPEIVFLTGDNIDSRLWGDKNATYLGAPATTQARVDFYYKGSHANGYRGVYDFAAPAFSCNGNHDHYERPDDGLDTKNKFKFWNKYHGLRTPHFAYGNTRFMAFSDAFGEDHNVQGARHTTWLKDVGPGNLRVIYKHIYNNVTPQPWATDNDIHFGMCGHNHHIGPKSPYKQGTTDMYIVNFTEYMTFNLFRIDDKGNYKVLNNLVAVENPKDDASLWKHKLTLTYAKDNNGSSLTNTATLTNKFDVAFPRARVRFIMPKGVKYKVSKGIITQQFDGDSVRVVDVRVPVKAAGTTTIKIRKDTGRSGIFDGLFNIFQSK